VGAKAGSIKAFVDKKRAQKELAFRGINVASLDTKGHWKKNIGIAALAGGAFGAFLHSPYGASSKEWILQKTQWAIDHGPEKLKEIARTTNAQFWEMYNAAKVRIGGTEALVPRSWC
jgi:hypothetical protein